MSLTNNHLKPLFILSLEDRFFSVVHSPDDETRHLTHADSGGGPGSSGSGSTPPTPTKTQPNWDKLLFLNTVFLKYKDNSFFSTDN